MPADWPQVWITDVEKARTRFPDRADRLLLCKTEPDSSDTPVERYVPVSALLGPDVVEAAARELAPTAFTKSACAAMDRAERQTARALAASALRAALAASVGEAK